MKLALLACALASASLCIPAEASPRKMNCGWPHPDPACSVTPPAPKPAPAPAPALARRPRRSTFWALDEVRQQVLNDLADALAMASAPISPQVASACEAPATWNAGSCSTPEVWDPLGAACFAGATAFINSLPNSATVPTVPTDPGAGLISAAEEARLIDLGAKNVINNISLFGFPNSFKVACDPWLLDYATQIGVDIAGAAGLNALLMKWIPAPVLAAHHLKSRL